MSLENPQIKNTSPSSRLGFWRVRYTFFIPLLYCYYFLNIDKIVVATLMPTISKEIGMNPQQIGKIFLFFGLAYGLSSLFGGFLTSKFGPKRVLAVSLSIFSLAIWFTGAVTSYVSFLLRYLIFGLAEGAEPAAALQIVMRWFPRWQRAKITALWQTNVTIAPLIISLLAVPIASAVGWRWTFGLAAMTGLVGVLLLKLFIFDRPEKFKRFGMTVSRAELEEIYSDEIMDLKKSGNEKPSIEDVLDNKKASIFAPLKNVNIRLFAIGQLLFWSVLWGINFWLPMYYTKGLGLSMGSMAKSMAFYYLCGFAGQIVSGTVSDYWGRRKRIVVGGAGSVGVLLILLSQFAASVPVPVFYLMIGLTAFCVMGCLTALHPLQSEIVGPDLTGSAYGFTNACGQVGTATTGLITGLLVYTVEGVQKYDHAMLYWAFCALVATVLFSRVKEEVRVSKGKLVA